MWLSRSLVLAPGMVLAALSSGLVLPLGADAAIVRLDAGGISGRPDAGVARLVIESPSQPPRRLAPWQLAGIPDRVVPAPDGRRAVLFEAIEDPRDGIRFWIADLAGTGTVRPGRLPRGLDATWASTARWSPDGERVLIDQLRVRPRGAAARAGRTPWRWRVVTCHPATAACATVPGATGAAAPLSGGRTLSATTSWTRLPTALVLAASADEGLPRWTPTRSALGRMMIRTARQRGSSSVRIDGSAGQVLRAERRALARGSVVAEDVLAGPAGALVVPSRLRAALRRRGSRVGLAIAERPQPLLAVAPDGTSRTIAPTAWTRAFQPLAPGRVAGRDDLRFVPRFALPDGRWLGDLDDGVPRALATMAPDGTTRPLRVGDRPATVDALLGAVGLRRRGDDPTWLTLRGYERATDSAIVAILRWSDRTGGVVLRVPLSGAAPTIAARGLEDEGDHVAAW
ncbi:hypothetical protein [Patulibacter defluvii]|uniref:hypothetical protein n=1 Tax=Patulibacter defluvii TaxID=3095358 RepID=UPI002A7641F1|nr:hypothetical protein [Patulibacter sp. DM4]